MRSRPSLFRACKRLARFGLDSLVWAGFIASWFVTSPALTSQLHLGLISHVLQDLSPKAFPKRSYATFVPSSGNQGYSRNRTFLKVHPKMYYSPSHLSKPVRPSFIFRKRIKIFLMQSDIFDAFWPFIDSNTTEMSPGPDM